MNLQQKTFCYEYLKDFNAVKAYVRAKYSAGSASANATKLLNSPEVDKFIKELMLSEWNLSKEQWLHEVRDVGKDNTKPTIKLRSLELYAKAKGYLAEGVTNITLFNKSFEQLFTTKDKKLPIVSQPSSDTQPIDTNRVTDKTTPD